MCLMQNRCGTAEARLAAMKEQSESAKEEAAEWKRKHEAVAAETKEVIERTISQKDKAIKQAQVREDTLRAEFTATVSQKVNDPFERARALCSSPQFCCNIFYDSGWEWNANASLHIVHNNFSIHFGSGYCCHWHCCSCYGFAGRGGEGFASKD